ncbi:MAG: OmpH family outer membrane protein [Proteobacteria bacterium]|nr:OmpH family outer membrane protein [Pseudomonadota bacterium]
MKLLMSESKRVTAICYVWVILVAVCFTASSYGQTAESQKNKNKPVFAVVNNQKIILSVPEGIKARKKIQAEINQAQASMEKKKKELESLTQNWEKDAELMNAEAKAKKQAELQQKIMTLRDEEMNFQKTIREKELSATQEIVKKIATYVQEIAETKKIDLVFESSQAGIMYIANYIDITDDVILKFDSAKEAKKATSPTESSK